MKKLLVFLGIFAFVLGVFLVVTGQFASDPRPDGEGAGAPGGTSMPETERGTFVRYPYFDAVKGRLAVEFSGYVIGSPDLIAIAASPPDSAKLQLRKGRVQVPLYATQQTTEPGVKVGGATVREFVFEFEQAEGIFSRGVQTVAIHRGGTGRADDGTFLDFEELQLTSDGASGWKASCGKRALLRREAMEIRAEKGFVASIDAAGLRRVEFQPPVRTFFLPGSEGLPFVVVPPVGGARSRVGAAAAESAVCVRCAGPLTIDREEAIIRYSRQVEIFPVETFEEGLLEKIPPTHARCELLTLQMDLGSKTLRGATAERGPNTPVQTFRADAQGGFNVEGDRLVWERGAGRSEQLIQGVTTLTGTPRMWGENWEVAAGRIRLDLDTRTADFEERVRGWFTGPERRIAGSEAAEGLPAANVWDFQAQTAKAEFEKGAEGEPFRLALERITAYGAEGGEAGGIEVRRRDKIPVIAYGPILRCTFQDRQIRTISMDSSLSVLRPRFSYGRSWLTAGRVVLIEDEGAAILENDVRAYVDAQADAASSPTGGTPVLHEIRAEKARVTLVGIGETRKLVIDGWGTPDRELTMKIMGDRIFRIFGDHLRWEQASGVATLTGEARPQRIELFHGELEATTLRFDEKKQTARADGKVRIRIRETEAAQPLAMSADHVEVHLRNPDAAAEAVATAAPAPASGPDPRPAPAAGGKEAPAEQIQRQLGQVHSAAAWVDDPAAGGVVVEGRGYHGSCERAEWDGRKRVLRFMGRGVQSLVLERSPERKDEVQASEVTCDWAANRIHLTGNVRGVLYLDRSLGRKTAGEPGPDKKAPEAGIPLAYQADEVEIEVVPGGDGGYDIGQVTATRHVQVENQSYQLKLTGHRLVYDATRQFVLIDAPADESSPELRRGGPEECRVTAREMRIWRLAPDDPADRTSPGKLAATLDRDVSMYLALEREMGSSPGILPQKVLVTAERVTFLFDPSRGASPQSSLVEARAEGNVVFSSGRYQGRADRALYDGLRRQLTLLGTQNGAGAVPAMVHAALQPALPQQYSAPVITLRNVGSNVLNIETPRGGFVWKDLELPWQRNRIRLPAPATSGSVR